MRIVACCQFISADDLHQFITLERVHLCLQHHERDAAPRVGLSAITDDLLTTITAARSLRVS